MMAGMMKHFDDEREDNTPGGDKIPLFTSHGNIYGSNIEVIKQQGSNIDIIKQTGSNTEVIKQPGSNIEIIKQPTGDIIREESHKSPKRAVSYRHEIVCTVACCFGNLAHGMAYGLASPAVPDLLDSGLLTETEASWFESLLILGALVGGLAVGPLINYLGRKVSILTSGPLFIAGWLCIACARTYIPLYAGRLLTGVAYGIVQVACPVYIAETVSREVRGTMGMGVVLGQTSGTLIQYSLGVVLHTRWLAVVAMLPVVGMLVGMTFMPESPRWLIRNNQKDKAYQALQWLRMADTVDDVEDEFTQIDASISTQVTVSWTEMMTEIPNSALPLVVCTMLFIFQQFSGITPIMFNAEWILSRVPSEGNDGMMTSGQLPSIILAAVKLVMTVCGMVLIDQLGRRTLFIYCGFIMTLSLAILGLFFYLPFNVQQNVVWLPLVALVVYVSSYSVAWGGIPWVVLSELPPLKIRGVASGLGSTGAWLSAFTVTQEFFTWEYYLQLYGVFWLYGGACLVGSLFALKFMPETKLKSLEDLEHELTISQHT